MMLNVPHKYVCSVGAECVCVRSLGVQYFDNPGCDTWNGPSPAGCPLRLLQKKAQAPDARKMEGWRWKLGGKIGG